MSTNDTSIVCGVDGSPDSEAALSVAAHLADALGARLVLVNVVEHVSAPYAGVGPMGIGAAVRPLSTTAIAEEDAAAAELLEEAAAACGLEDADRRVVAGFAAERLAEVADEEAADLIVVGSRGRGAFKAAFLGSVSTSLIGIARCPVLVVPRRMAR